MIILELINLECKEKPCCQKIILIFSSPISRIHDWSCWADCGVMMCAMNSDADAYQSPTDQIFNLLGHQINCLQMENVANNQEECEMSGKKLIVTTSNNYRTAGVWCAMCLWYGQACAQLGIEYCHLPIVYLLSTQLVRARACVHSATSTMKRMQVWLPRNGFFFCSSKSQWMDAHKMSISLIFLIIKCWNLFDSIFVRSFMRGFSTNQANNCQHF